MSRNILAIHAHPDDVEILAGGTLALLAETGHSITIVTMTPGDCGSADQTPEAIAAIRRAEAVAGAARIGASYFCAEFRDLSIFSDDSSRRRVVEVLRKTRPDLILTSAPVDYMADHDATSALVRDACFAAPARNYQTASAPLDRIPHLYFMAPIGGHDNDDFHVDIGRVFAIKMQMLAEHRSQREWLMKHHGIDDYLEMTERWTREAGTRAGVEFAEGFRHYKGHPYPATPLLEDLLGSHVRR